METAARYIFVPHNPEHKSTFSEETYIVAGDNIKVRRDENGIITIGLRNFLLDENSLKL